MNVGVIGLGRMGSAIASRLVRDGHMVIGYDAHVAQAQAEEKNIMFANSVKEVAQKVEVIWLMVPAGTVIDDVINEIIPYSSSQMIIIDGGNSFYKDSVRRAQMLAEKNIGFLDCGTSGGLHGKELGFSLMVGGQEKYFNQCSSLFAAIAANNKGFALVGPSGAGHYVKMVHNGIEYALLQAYAEGFNLLKHGEYNHLDLAQIADVWEHGSIIRSWILQLTENVLKRDQDFAHVSGEIAESGTGRWTVDAAHEQKIPVDLIERALEIRAQSRQNGGNYATKLVALLRHEFGGHAYKKL